MDKEIKRKIRALRKIKKSSRKKTALRREMNRKIRELKNLSHKNNEPMTPEKQALIDKILSIREYHIDLSQHTIEALKHHLNKLLEKKNDKNT